MKARTCPHCDYQYSRVEYLKLQFAKFSFSEWNCRNCKQNITFSFKRRALIALFNGLWFFLFYYLKSHLEMTLLIWIVFLLVFILGLCFLITFEGFKKVDN
jgi:CXXC-20-CXXC protein